MAKRRFLEEKIRKWLRDDLVIDKIHFHPIKKRSNLAVSEEERSQRRRHGGIEDELGSVTKLICLDHLPIHFDLSPIFVHPFILRDKPRDGEATVRTELVEIIIPRRPL